MNWLRTVVIGAIIGVLDGGGIFFAPAEPYQVEIFSAAILKGILVSVATGLTLATRPDPAHRRGRHGAAWGALYGFLFAAVVFLAKGGFKSLDAPYVVPAGIVMGTLTGLLVARFGPRSRDRS